MDKLKFTDWSEVQRRFGSGEIAIFQQRMMFVKMNFCLLVQLCEFLSEGAFKKNHRI